MSEVPLRSSDDSKTGSVAWTALAHLLRPQGRRGEVLGELLTDFPERFENGARVFLAKPGFAGDSNAAREITVGGHWLPVGRNHGRIVLTLQGIDSIEKAEELAGLDVLVPAEERVALADDAEYISDLMGCAVYDGEVMVGRVMDVEFPSTADGSRRLEDAAPLLIVETDAGDEVMIPYVQQFLVRLSVEAKRIEMNLPEGLVELNRGGKPTP